MRLGYPLGSRGVDGQYGPDTEKAVSQFQSECGLPADGTVDQRTWWAMVEKCYNLGDRLLYLRWPFLRGEDVRELQELLANLGFRVGRVDAIFGPATDKAVREFQRNMILPLDGIVGQATLGALKNLQNILTLHPRTMMPWTLVRPQQKTSYLSDHGVFVQYQKPEDQDLLRGRKRLAAQIAALLRVAGARVRVRGVSEALPMMDEGCARERDIFLGIGFAVGNNGQDSIDGTDQDVSLVYPTGEAHLASTAFEFRMALSKITGRPVSLKEISATQLSAPGIYIVLSSPEEELLRDESLRQRVAVAIVDSLGRSSRENGSSLQNELDPIS